MADESVDFQTTVVATPPANTKVAVDIVNGLAYQRVKLDGGGDGALVPIVAGRNADATSLPVALSTEDVAILNLLATSAKQDTGNTSLSILAGIVSAAKAAVKSAAGDIVDLATALTSIGALTETAPATDTASSGLNGRLQRIAQRLTSIIALLPSAVGATSKAGSLSVALATDQKFTTSWTTQTSVIAIRMLALGAVARGTLATTGKFGGYLTIFVMRSGSTALTAGVDVRVRRLHSSAPAMHGGALASFTGGKTTAVQGVAAGSGNNAGVATLTLNAAKTFAAGPNGDIMLGVIDDTTTPTLASEILRQIVATSTTAKLLEYPTESAHNSTSHVVADQPDLYEVWVDAGETIEVTISYGTSTTGDSVCVGAYYASLDSIGAA